MTCNQCGAEAPAGAAYCPQCGAQLLADQNAPAANHRSGGTRMQSGGSNHHDAPEQDLWAGAYSPKAMAGGFILAGLLTIAGMVAASFGGPIAWIAVVIGALVLFGFLGLRVAYKRMSMQYRLTTHRLVLEKGILSRTDDRILLVDVDDITVRQGLLNRLLNIGTIILNTTDESTRAANGATASAERGILIMDGIEDPRLVGDLIDEARRTERSRRGLYMMNA